MKTLTIAAIATLLTTPAFAQDADSQPVILPAEVQAQVDALRAYGDRFEKVIAAIEAEHAKPSWGWQDDCGHDMIATALPES